MSVCVHVAVPAGEAVGVDVVVVAVVVVMLVGVLHRRERCWWTCAERNEIATPTAATAIATICTGSIASDSTTHASTAPTNGAVASITCPRAAPSYCAPRTHSVIDMP